MSKIKGLGIAFVAIAAMSMAAASAAQATQLHITSKENSVLTGTRAGGHTEHIFTTDSGQVKCTDSRFEATVTGAGGQATQTTTQDVQFTGTYTGCTGFGLAATIDMNGCKYTITGSHSVTGATASKTAYVDITGCTAGKKIEVTAAAGCVVTVPEQHNLSHIQLTNVGSAPHDITADITIANIAYEGHGLCPSLPATTVTNNGTYTGQLTIQAFTDEPPVQATHNGHQYSKYQHNNVNLSIIAT